MKDRLEGILLLCRTCSILGDMGQDDMILTELLLDHTAVIFLNEKKCIL